MRRVITFPDVLADMIKALRTTLTELGVTDVRVASEKLTPEQVSTVTKEVIVSSSPGRIVNRYFLENEFTIALYVENTNKSQATAAMNALELKMYSALGYVKQNSESIKIVENISSTPFGETGNSRITSFLCTVTSTALTIEEQ
jgi:hypothetical protein